MSGIIIVGVSGSEHAHPAIAWAVDHATTHATRLEFVHVVDVGRVFAGTSLASEAVVAAEERITEIAERVISQHPELTATGVVVVGGSERALVEHARDVGASLIVVGSHADRGALAEVYSRRAARIAASADCTVVVVPSPVDPRGRIGVVVGVDGSEVSAQAVRFAAEEASILGEALTAVYAAELPWPWGVEPQPARFPRSVDDEVVLAEALAGIAEDHPDLEVRRSLPGAHPVEALALAAAGARLLVVGSHGRPAAGRLWFGSVGSDLLLRMPSPIAVVR
ncbi:universal stress protein [Protaetiibacter mangrovi]|uniref:Universal stress protein n=1 Tax=Protaetiibacter mangrovi TaxID=2970926 RepID=A0ABT1ZC05_9MICO|nr:universal stress protein [Protaetiibacter mangrovi]MCS0498226.1 universal stress protein [Protaetiibacter mangrovi]TPX04193.1 universal stress protein [Schumannella luteola]